MAERSIILGDIHLGKSVASLGKSGVGNTLNSRLVDQLNILDWTLDRCVREEVSNLILTGDIFEDPKPHPTIITLFVSWIKKCTDNGIKVHIISGNHDILRTGQFYASALDIILAADIEDVFIYRHINTIHTRGASFTLMPFRDRRSFNMDSNAQAIISLRSKLPYELAEIEAGQAKIIVGHLAIEGSIFVGDEIDNISNELFCPLDMFNGYDYVWMGHIHKPQVMSKSPYISHIGSMDLSDFGEADHKKVIVIIDPDKSEPYRYIEIPSRPLKQVSISVPIGIENTTNYVIENLNKETFNKAIVRLNILLDSPELLSVDRTIIEKHLTSMGAFHITRISEEKKVALLKKDATSESLDNTVNEKTAVKMYADANIEEKSRENFVSLATSIITECFEKDIK